MLFDNLWFKYLLSPIHLQDGRKWKYSLYGFIICIFPDQLSMEILRGKNGFINLSGNAHLIFPWTIKGAKTEIFIKSLYWINPFSPINISTDKLSGNIQIINPETPLIVRFRPIIFPWKYRNNISVDNISAHFLQMNRTRGGVKNGRKIAYVLNGWSLNVLRAVEFLFSFQYWLTGLRHDINGYDVLLLP